MPTFDTPDPISVTIELALGDARIIASDRTDTVVEVRPRDATTTADVKAAEQTRVEYAGGMLLVKAPKPRGLSTFLPGGPSIDVTIELPTGSHVQGEAGAAAFRSEGRLGECRLKTGVGDIQLDRTGRLHLTTGAGAITVDSAVGNAEVKTGSGAVRMREIDGTAVIKNANGSIWVGEITGDLRVNTANGSISADRAHATVSTKTANGDIRIGEVVRGTVVLETSMGQLEVGIRSGTAARLDVSSQFGHVHNSLTATGGPESSEETVEVRARTSFGDIDIHRA